MERKKSEGGVDNLGSCIKRLICARQGNEKAGQEVSSNWAGK